MMRFPPRRILAAVDGTPASLRAWSFARDAAERFGAALHVVYCQPPISPELAAYPAEYAEELRVQKLLEKRLGAEARLHKVRAWPESALPRLARELRCDLLIMGVTRRTPLGRAVKGSVAEAVVRESPCPVLVVPRRRAIRRVLAPVNEGDYAVPAMAAAALVAKAYGARLDLLHVVTDPLFGTPPHRLLRRTLEKLPPRLREGVRCLSRVVRHGAVADIVDEARAHDLVVLAEHRKSAVGDWLLGTTAERVLRRSSVPVLAIPPRRRTRKGVVLV